uniref:RRM domain-containing protein n=1 Tax=Equus caballus TaxID=9796 RepID=A0A3Q2HUL3_HORSE
MSSEEGKLLAGRFNFHIDEWPLGDLFSSSGPLSEVVIAEDQATQQSQRFGFITFTNPEWASDAMRALNGESLDGCQIRGDHAGGNHRDRYDN